MVLKANSMDKKEVAEAPATHYFVTDSEGRKSVKKIRSTREVVEAEVIEEKEETTKEIIPTKSKKKSKK